ncbi:dynein axonemal heavy chain 2-like [Plutella xylostella]|uniref:dynein axonemal heavy chain 2-like n=1 Tax=Plutella xylostella TaxID=51655 RepID=UPI002032EBC6|nr:dynein axonemal heavy chain 2-like [Plutella xylostella]
MVALLRYAGAKRRAYPHLPEQEGVSYTGCYKQEHYDFGLRSMVALLRYAGAKRRAYPHLPEQEGDSYTGCYKQEHYDFGLRSMVALLRYAGAKRRAYPHLPEQEGVSYTGCYKQEHYDFGLRSMVALLRYAGAKRRAYPHLPEQEGVSYTGCYKQEHYDFGLRSMVALLRYAGAKRRAYPHLPEQEMVILAMRDMNVARLTAKDVPLFEGIMQDIFPDVVIPTLDYEVLETAIAAEMKMAGLQPVKAALHKVVQLYETKNSRHSSIILGDTNTAKSTSWKMLANTLTRLNKEKVAGFEAVQVYPMNPKALTLGELYGEYNLSTGEWKDGVLSAIMRTVCQDESPDLKWIIFDGPVDALWIENLNSVMDDNKLLTLVNSERIAMPAQVSLLIETLELAAASPATVSRNGMVYSDYRALGWAPSADSWLQTVAHTEYRNRLRALFTSILPPVLELKRLHLTEGASVRGQQLTGVIGLCRLLEKWPAPAEGEDDENLVKMRFLFALIWSIGATLEEDSRKKLDNWIREHEGIFPLKGTVYDYYIDDRLGEFRLWEEKLPDGWRYNPDQGFHSILVPTAEFLRVQCVMSDVVLGGCGVLLGGRAGAGKTCLVGQMREAEATHT